MNFVHGKNTEILVNQYRLTPYFNKSNFGHAQELHDSTVYGQNSKSFMPGLRSGDITLEGFFEASATPGNPQAALEAALAATPNLLSMAPRGFAIGNEVTMLAADEKDYKVTMSQNALTMIIANLQSTRDSAIEGGVSLHSNAAAETTSTDSASVDNAASSGGGYAAFLHVTGYVTLTNAIIKVQHSSDNITFADLAVFSTATAITSERLTGTGTVNRYLRVRSTLSGSGSITYAVGVARRG